MATVVVRYVLVHKNLSLLHWENETNDKTTNANQHLEQSRHYLQRPLSWAISFWICVQKKADSLYNMLEVAKLVYTAGSSSLHLLNISFCLSPL